MTTTRFYSIGDVKQAAYTAGNWFFEPGTMGWFGTSAVYGPYQAGGRTYIITRDQNAPASIGKLALWEVIPGPPFDITIIDWFDTLDQARQFINARD